MMVANGLSWIISKATWGKWEHLTITNDIMFGKVMENEQICLELIQRSLPELNIKAISRITPQKQITGPISARTVRFDVFVRDEE